VKKRHGGVYRITAPNGDFYIGSSAYVVRRIGHHLSAMKRGKSSKRLQAAADKFGAESLIFEVLYCATDSKDLWSVEQHFIDELRPTLNVSAKAKLAIHDEAVLAKSKATTATSARHREARAKNQTLAARGISKSIVCLETGVVYQSSYEAARAVGVTHKDSMATAANKGWRCGGFYWAWAGSGITLQDRINAAQAAEDARRAKSAENMTATTRRPVVRASDGQVFYSIAEAARQCGCHHTAIHRAANNGGIANGTRWAYA
jgi:group I intron endonuclease